MKSQPTSKEVLRLQVVAHDSVEGTEHISFSHVWSHIRGNPSGNRLPLCQLARLASLAARGREAANGYCAFWIDTLCVPVSPKWARKKAILQMREVYSKAESTIVLDENLECSTRDPSNMEVFGSLTLSDWTTRLWTVQESMLSRRVRLLFGQDTLIDFDDLIRTEVACRAMAFAMDNQLHGRYYRLQQDLGFYLSSLRRLSVLRLKSGEQENAVQMGLLNRAGTRSLSDPILGTRYVPPSSIGITITEMLMSLHHRRTSHRHVEAICLAVLLGLDHHLSTVIDDPSDATAVTGRYERLLQCFDEAPRAFLFSPGPRFHSACMKWAPRSFMGAFHPEDHFSSDFFGQADWAMGQVTPEGLLTTVSGLRVKSPPPFRTGTPRYFADGTTGPALDGRTQHLDDILLAEHHLLGMTCPTCSTTLRHIITYDNTFLHAAEDAERNLLPGSTGKVEASHYEKRRVGASIGAMLPLQSPEQVRSTSNLSSSRRPYPERTRWHYLCISLCFRRDPLVSKIGGPDRPRQIVLYAPSAGDDVRKKKIFRSAAPEIPKRLPASTKWCIG